MTGDRLIESVRKIVLRCLDDSGRIDRARRYPGTVLSQDPTSYRVDVEMDDERLGTLPDVPVAPPPGLSALVWTSGRRGTRVSVGWLEGDEQKPRAYLEWDSGGGAASLSQSLDRGLTLMRPGDAPAYTGPLLEVRGDLAEEHGLLRGPAPTIVPAGAAATLVAGTDQLFTASVVVAAPLPVGTPLFTAVFGRAYTGASVLALACASGCAGASATASQASVSVLGGANAVAAGLLVLSPGAYLVTVLTRGTLA